MKICILSLTFVMVLLFKVDTLGTIVFPHQFEELKNSKLDNSTDEIPVTSQIEERKNSKLENSTAEIPVTSDESQM